MIVDAHAGFAAAIDWSPDSATLATAGMDGFLRLWDRRTGNNVGEVRAHQAAVNGAAFTSLGREVVTGSSNSEVRLWALPDLDLRYELFGHSDRVGAVAAHADGSPIVSASDDGSVLVFTEPGKSLKVEGLGGRMTTVDLSADGTLVAAAGHGGEVLVFDLIKGTSQRLEGHERAVGSVAFSTSGLQLFTLGAEGVVRIWDTSSWMVEEAVPVGGFGPLAVAPGGSLMAVAIDGSIVTINRNGSIVGTREWDGGDVYAMAYAPDSSHLAAVCTDGTLRLWPTDF
ncbi:MAG: WD40 repeat domain-containing protein [Acidimicrobiia bacterium]|nr:WD40 repeat domain-containing protein [Acidimicrobiia bacterium]